MLTKPSDLLFFAGPCAGGSSWARLNKTRGVDAAEKIKAKQKEFLNGSLKSNGMP